MQLLNFSHSELRPVKRVAVKTNPGWIASTPVLLLIALLLRTEVSQVHALPTWHLSPLRHAAHRLVHLTEGAVIDRSVTRSIVEVLARESCSMRLSHAHVVGLVIHLHWPVAARSDPIIAASLLLLVLIEEVRPVVKHETDASGPDDKQSQVTGPAASRLLTGVGSRRPHVLVLRLRCLLNSILFGRRLTGFKRSLYSFRSVNSEAHWEYSLELGVGVCHNHVGFESSGNFRWHHQCQVVLVTVDLGSRPLVLKLSWLLPAIRTVLVVNSDIEIRAGEDLYRNGAVIL